MDQSVTTHRDPATIPGTEEWVEANAKYTRNMLRGVEGDCALVADKLPHFREWCGRHAVDWEAFCSERLLIKAGFLEKIEEGVRILRAGGYAGPITREQAVRAHAEQARPLAHQGGARTGAGRPEGVPNGLTKESSGAVNNQVDQVNLPAKGGNRSSYLSARIARDAPDVLEQMKRGAFQSVRAAAKAAGIIRDKTRLEKAQALVRRMDERELYEFEAWFDEELQRRRQA